MSSYWKCRNCVMSWHVQLMAIVATMRNLFAKFYILVLGLVALIFIAFTPFGTTNKYGKKNWRLFASDPIQNTNGKMIIQFFPLYFKLLHRSLIVQSISNNYTYTYQLTSYGYVKSDNFPFVFFLLLHSCHKTNTLNCFC